MRDRRVDLGWKSSLSGIERPYLVLLATLLIAVGLFGGSSRYDMMQNALIQPVAWLVAGVALAMGGAGKAAYRNLRWPLFMLLALLVITLLQVIPLPYALWTSLPGREPLAEIATAVGSDIARPLSMVPSRTLNALSALGIPLAALLLLAGLGTRGAYIVLAAMVLLAAANALLAILQIGSGYADAGYLYSLTNEGTPVGIFANRNHSAVFGSLAMLVIGFLVTRPNRKAFPGSDILLWSAFGAIFLVILVNGSRAGLLTAGIALAAAALLVVSGKVPAASPLAGRRSAGGKRSNLVRYLPAAVILFFAVGMIALFLLADRLTAFQRIVEANPLEDLRFRIVPILLDMIGTYFPLGTGLGAFEDVFRIHETPELLGPRYLNMAHNDWLQWFLETGLPGAALLVAFLGWLGYQLLRLKARGRDYLTLGLAGFAILALASYFDYPLRTPLFQVAGVWFVCALALLARAEGRETNRDPAVVTA